MSEQETMRLVAEVVDKFSGPLKDMQKSLGELAHSAKGAHENAAKSAREHLKHVKMLHEAFAKLRETTVELVSPALAAVGVSGLSAAAGIQAVVDASRRLGETGRTLEMVGNRSGMSAQKIQELGEMAAQAGISVQQMNEGISNFGEFLDQTSKGMPEALKKWNEFPLAYQKIGKSLIGMKRDMATEKALDFLDTMTDKSQKRQLLGLLGLPQDWASFSRETIDNIITTTRESFKRHPAIDPHAAEQADKAWRELGATIRGIGRDFDNMVGPSATEGMKAVREFLDDEKNIQKFKDAMHSLTEQLKSEFKDIKAVYDVLKLIWDGPSDPWWEKSPSEVMPDWLKSIMPGNWGTNLKDSQQFKGTGPGKSGQRYDDNASRLKGGIQPISFGDDRRAGENLLRDGVKQGVLDAFRELMGGGSAAPGVSGGGFTNANYSPSGGGGGSGGRWGGSGYSDLSGGNPAVGGSAPSVMGGGGGAGGPMPSGNKAQNAQRIYDELRNLGHTHEQASGALGHVNAESGFNPNATGDHGTAHGFFQHRGSRWATALRDAAKSGSSPLSPEAAAQHFDRELRNEENRSGRKYFNSKSTQDAVTALNGYERFAGWQRGQAGRYSAAERFARQMKPSGGDSRSVFDTGAPPVRGLLENGKRSGLMGGETNKVTGDASLTIDLNGFPRGTRTASSHSGMFKEVRLNRGRPMGMASEEA